MKTAKCVAVRSISDDVENFVLNRCHFLLTHLASVSSGVLSAMWNDSEKNAIWKYSSKSEVVPDAINITLLEQSDLATFRSILAHLGQMLADDTYIGGATFKLQVEGVTYNDRLYAIFFSNAKQFGYWIRLYIE